MDATAAARWPWSRAPAPTASTATASGSIARPRLNANEWQNNLANLGKAQLQQNIFGGGIGGPVIKNKTFFFVQIQELRARSSAATSRTVYTATARTGVLRYVKGGRNQPAGNSTASVDANGNPLPGLSIGTYNVAANDPQHIGLDPTVLAEIKNEPLPNQFNVGDGLNTAGYIFSAQASERQHDQTIKIDQIVNAKNTVYGRVAWGRDDSICDVVNTGQPVFPGGPCLVNTLRGPRNFAVNWRFTPTSRMTNELVVGENRYDPHLRPALLARRVSFTAESVPERYDASLRQFRLHQLAIMTISRITRLSRRYGITNGRYARQQMAACRLA